MVQSQRQNRYSYALKQQWTRKQIASNAHVLEMGIYMKLKIAICDDEQNQTEYIASLVSAWGARDGHICEIRTFASAEEFLFEYEDDREYDILLLDVEMKTISGIDLAKSIRRQDSAVQIIFVTGYPEYMSEGYDVAALHYLMKPVSSEKLSSVLDRAVAGLKTSEKRIRIAHDRRTDFVPISQVIYIEAQKQYVLIRTSEETYRMKCALTDMEAQLDEYFFRCQRSFIVNLRYVARVSSDCVLLKDGAKVPISRGMAEKIGKEIIRLF